MPHALATEVDISIGAKRMEAKRMEVKTLS